MVTRTVRSVLFTVVLVMLVGLIAPVSVSAASAPGGRQPENARLQALLDELVETGAPGVVALVDDGRGPTWRGASGAAQLDPLVPLRPSARFRVGSITKTFVSVVVLQLVGEGRLGLNDSVERWLPGLVPGGDAINVRQLLNHTSGIFNYTDDPEFINDLITDPLRTLTPEELVAVAIAYPPLFEPGTSWSYSNTNYILAGLIIQAVTGRDVQGELQRRIFTPLGLGDTSFPVTDPDIAGYHAHGYFLPGNPFIPTDVPIDVTRLNPSGAWAAGAVISTADDLARFYEALLGGRLLRPALLREMLTAVQVDPVFGYGLGIYTMRTACGTVWGHDGGIPGYVSIALNNREGTRNLVLMMSTYPDAQTGPLLSLTLDSAVCAMLDRDAASRAAPMPTQVTSAAALTLLR
jgi:D-alanyl-D-alanine carboxypeptidase